MIRGISSAPRPHGFLRRVVRAPLGLYHRDLGFLFGRRLLYLAHQGRLTGLRRETMLGVARLDHETGEIVVFSTRGPRADWYKNLRAGRALEIRIGHLRFTEPEHRFLPEEERRAVLVACREAYPRAWALGRLFGLPADPKNDDVGGLRAVAFRPVTWRVPE